MKTIFIYFLIFLSFLGISQDIFACSVPPDIIHEFRINTNENPITITYSLSTWDNLRGSVMSELWNDLERNLENILAEKILSNTKISYNNENISLTFLTGNLLPVTPIDEWSYIPNPILKAKYKTNLTFDKNNISDFSLTFEKKIFTKISPLIHPYLTSDIQNGQVAEWYALDDNGKFYDIFGDFVVQTNNTEGDIENIFTLQIQKNSEKFINPNTKNTTTLTNQNPTPNSSEKIDFFKPLDTLKNFFEKNISLGMQIFGVFIALISGMMHGLLPGHSKSLLVAHIASSGQMRKKEIFTIISSVTASHTAFIFLISIAIIALQKGTGVSVTMVQHFSSVLYIAFGIFFVFLGIRSLRKFSKNHHKHKNPLHCDCCEPKSLKQTTIVGILAGLNPCVDAIILFVFALGIGNIFFASILIIVFSFGIGIMLAIIAFSLNSGKNFFLKNHSLLAQKFSFYTTILMGIILAIIGIYHFL